MSDERAAIEAREGREECLEAFYRLERAGRPITLQSLDENPDLRDINISASLLELVEQGDIRLSNGEIGLMPSGRLIGRRIFRRHELVERFLQVVGLRRERAHREACRFEHFTRLPGERLGGLSERAELQVVIDLLNRGAVPLTHGILGAPYRLGMICAGHGARRKLEDMGVSGGAEITLCSRHRSGPVEILVRGSRLALGRGIASKVLVVPTTEHGAESAHRWRAALEGSEPSRRRGGHRGRAVRHHGPHHHR